VALPEGSLVVNSSMGGGSKDTMVLDRPRRYGLVGYGDTVEGPDDADGATTVPPAQVSMRSPDPGPATQQSEQQQQQ
jgi:hypothetical protein